MMSSVDRLSNIYLSSCVLRKTEQFPRFGPIVSDFLHHHRCGHIIRVDGLGDCV